MLYYEIIFLSFPSIFHYEGQILGYNYSSNACKPECLQYLIQRSVTRYLEESKGAVNAEIKVFFFFSVNTEHKKVLTKFNRAVLKAK